MLYNYPYIKSEVYNLHGYICQLLRKLRGTDLSSFEESICPIGLKGFMERSGILKDLVEKFVNAYLNLPTQERIQVFKIFVNINAIELLSKDKTRIDLLSKNELPESIQSEADRLFKFLFKDTLKLDNKLREHYKNIYEIIKKEHKSVCPFCGLENLISPILGMPDYDHLLYKDNYPFAAVNMRNLVPMCPECNRRFKRTTDLLFDGSGVRRKFFFPYKEVTSVQMDLSKSPIPDDSDNGSDWIVEFQPDCEEVKTWIAVFRIQDRYKEEVFEKGFFNDWIEAFKKHSRRFYPLQDWGAEEVKSVLKDYLELIDKTDFKTLGFIQYAVFKFLLEKAPNDYFEDLGTVISS